MESACDLLADLWSSLKRFLDVPPGCQSDDTSPFLLRASHFLSGGRMFKEMKDEEFQWMKIIATY